MHTTGFSADAAVGARGWLYVLPASGGEDLLKVGLTNDPLSRFSAFHPRWYEAFDLAHCLLVACERRSEAQALETALHRELVAHSCPMPLTIRAAAAGATEWYRGAYVHALRFVDECAGRGHRVEYDARVVLHPAQAAKEFLIDGLLRQAHDALLAGWMSAPALEALIDLVEGHLYFDPNLEQRLPQDIWQGLQQALP